MEKVELIELSNEYLNELGYENLDKALIAIKDNNVKYKIINNLIKKNKKQLNIQNLEVSLSDKSVIVLDQINDYIYSDEKDFATNKGTLEEKNTKTRISFNKINDTTVIKSFNSMIKINNRKEKESIVTASHNEAIEVNKDYKLTDGYPNKKNFKKLIKE